MKIDYEAPDVRLDLIGMGHAYAGFDRFLRIVDQKWYDYGASADVDRYKTTGLFVLLTEELWP